LGPDALGLSNPVFSASFLGGKIPRPIFSTASRLKSRRALASILEAEPSRPRLKIDKPLGVATPAR